jgi:hypothetical protein
MGFTDKFSADRQRFSRNFSLEPAPNKETSGSRDRTIKTSGCRHGQTADRLGGTHWSYSQVTWNPNGMHINQ